jgi:UPF0755 protein
VSSRNLVFKLLGVLILLSSFALGWLIMDYNAFLRTPVNIGAQDVTYVIEPGTSVKRLARDLQAQGIIEKPWVFIAMTRLRGVAGAIKAGEYAFRPGLTPPQLLEQIVKGEVIQYALTLVEGWSFRQVMAAVDADPHLEHTLSGLDDAAIMAALGYSDVHPEGRFYPDTYHFSRGMTDVAFLQRAYTAMAQRLAEEWAQRKEGLPLKTPDEALILASIIEKETGLVSERDHIAGVFVRRLKKGMYLQTDPTVIYGLGPAFDGNLRRRDLQADTPYNTYRRKGLPPTPIAMPGGDAIRAALHPAPGKALYFVARGDGSHQFSATLAEHNKAVIKYQLGGKARPFSSRPAARDDVKTSTAN